MSLKRGISAMVVKSTKPVERKDITSEIKSRRSESDNPSPIDFDKFMPWVCLNFEILVEVVVLKAALEKHVPRRKASSFSSRTRLKSTEEKSQLQIASLSANLTSKHKKPLSIQEITNVDTTNKIPITAYYDASGHLAEIAINKSKLKINRKIIKCINICLPFHPALYKISIKSGLTCDVLYEVAKMLPHSNITDVCLDDTSIPEGNYFILLDRLTPLKMLSLKRCKINDIVCMEISKRIDLGGNGAALSVLDLGSNQITDRGIWYLADVLRRNRSLRHLGLSDNKITDYGFKFIMNHLKEFQMNKEEILGRKRRRIEFIRNVGLNNLVKRRDSASDGVVNHETQVHFRRGKQKSPRRKKQSAIIETTNVSAEAITKEEFSDVFDDDNIIIRDENMNCIGNFVLCSLNMAYNELDYFSVKRILDVLNYQKKLHKPPLTGLVRLMLDGNFIPQECDELNEIHLYLTPNVSSSVHSQRGHLKSRSTMVRKH
ncbi:uncharacterized protein LOC106131408 [Amyelois transitella]|uniref:uncharacterized protein LOC106131408 n=1 Tax=Amyelois transitella TaxID=680683 RepID=UPI00298F4133|nr:uncharacterized protein LOC106131408 [Amyelois transitella]